MRAGWSACVRAGVRACDDELWGNKHCEMADRDILFLLLSKGNLDIFSTKPIVKDN